MVRIHEIDTELIPEEDAPPADPPAAALDPDALRELVRALMREELERFLRLEARR